MTQEVKIIADSISPSGVRITTFQLKYQRFIHSEFMTHRQFSRSASSSRAIPIAKMIAQVRSDPAMPHEWGKNQPGMQAREELSPEEIADAKRAWMFAANNAANVAEGLATLGLHKQVVNRLLEPFQWIHVVVTSTDYDNFFALRNHPDAQPEIRDLAIEMQDQYDSNRPNRLDIGEWHLPYIRTRWSCPIDTLKKVSAARCCRVSYNKHDGHDATIDEDIALFEKLVTANPPHMSPVEHQAQCTDNDCYHGNFWEWLQYRKILELDNYTHNT
jgi:hypothetical protein